MIIQVDNITDGMILDEPILNNLGFVLVPSGFQLTEKHKKMLVNWNIKTVSIVSDEEVEDEKISDDLIAKAKEIIDTRIKWEPSNTIEKIIIEKAILSVAVLIKYNKLN